MDSTQHENLLGDLRKIIAYFPGAMIIFTIKDTVITSHSISRKFAEMLGYSCPEEAQALMDDDPFHNVHPDDIERLEQKVNQANIDGKPFEHAFRTRRHYGDYLWVQINFTILENNPEYGIVVSAIYTDISAQKIAEQHYAETLIHRENILKNMATAYARLNLTKNSVSEIVSHIESKINILSEDISTEQFLQHLVSTIVLQVERDHYVEILTRENLLRSFAIGRHDLEIETRCNASDGIIRWIKHSITLIQNPYSRDIECYIYAFDINNEKFVHEVIGSFIENIGISLSCINVKTAHFNLLSPRPGIPDEGDYDTIRRALIDERVSSEIQEKVFKDTSLPVIIEKLNQEATYGVHFHTRKNDDMRFFRFLFYYLNELHNDIVLVTTDITEVVNQEKLLQAKLSKALLTAHAAEKAKDTFFSSMSHDIRTPLNAIIGLSNIALRGNGVPPETYGFLEKIHSSGEYLLGIVNDILDVSQIENRKLVLHQEPYSFAEFSDQIRTVMMPLIQQKNIKFDFHYDGDPEKRILTDRLRINQIFLNLLSNAVKFTPENGEVNFIVHYVGRQEKAFRNVFTIRDNGSGISPEFLPHLFDMFAQEHSSKDGTRQGSGLGMTIVKNLIELMGGTVEVQSKLGEGTEFTVTLDFQPVSSGIRSSFRRPAELPKPKIIDTKIFAQKRVLLAEDDAINREIINLLFTEKNINIENAENGEVALKMFSDAPAGYYALILMDMQMPKLNGLLATKAIRALARADAQKIPIIAMTANVMQTDIDAAIAAGMNAHLGKPVNEEEMWQVIGKYLEQ